MNSVTASEKDQRRELRRCAVFKIDLTGRFVFVDKPTEKLLKLPEDLLFGQFLGEFLAENSNLIIQEILGYGKLYETFYEAAELTFIDSHKNIEVRQVIISLNFIGGNPVNYQIVVIPDKDMNRETIPDQADNSLHDEVADWIGNLGNKIVWRELLDILDTDDNIIQSSVYLLSKEKLSIVAEVTDPLFIDKGFDLKKLDANHKKVIKSNKPYFGHGDNKQDGLTEICFPLTFKGNPWGMLRVVVKGDGKEYEDTLASQSNLLGTALSGYVD